MTLISAIVKLKKRRKNRGFYHGTDILTHKEKEILFLTGLLVVLPLLITGILVILN